MAQITVIQTVPQTDMEEWPQHPLPLDSGQGSEEPAEKSKKEAKLKPRQYMKTMFYMDSLLLLRTLV